MVRLAARIAASVLVVGVGTSCASAGGDTDRARDGSDTAAAGTAAAATASSATVNIPTASFVVLDPPPSGLEITEVSPRRIDDETDPIPLTRTFARRGSGIEEGERRQLALVRAPAGASTDDADIDGTVEVQGRTFALASDAGNPIVLGATPDGIEFALVGLGVDVEELIELAPAVVARDGRLVFDGADPPSGFVDTGTTIEAMGVLAAATGSSTPPSGASIVYGTPDEPRSVVVTTWPVIGDDTESTAQYAVGGAERRTVATGDGELDVLITERDGASFVLWNDGEQWIGLFHRSGSVDESIALAADVRRASDEESASLAVRIDG